jgi:peptide/nickel transport system substrate-binding protein
LTQSRLARINSATQELEPWLADSWTRSDDGRTYTVKLRPGLAFADGHPFTSDDVVFSFRAVYDAKASVALRGDLLIGGQPIAVSAPDPSTVVLTLPTDFAPGLWLLDTLPMLPKHKLEAALNAGRFAEAWSLSTPVSEITGLGPFVLTEYRPGQRLVFARNPRYFRKDANGVQLPYLDGVILEIVPDQDAQMLRLSAGQSDMSSDEIRPEDYAELKRAADAGRLQLFDLGEGALPDSFWINLKPGAFGNDPRAAWLQSEELRHAISHAVDRKAFADTVYLGAGSPVYGPVTPANRKWHWPELPRTPHDPARARSLLAKIGLQDRNGDGALEDAGGRPARFSLSVMKGRTSLERGAAVIREELKKIGIVVDVEAIEGNALVQRFMTNKGYEAAYFQLGSTDLEPSSSQELWLSSGGFHVWNLGQKTPATEWERQIDEAMRRYATAKTDADAKRAFDEAQRIFAEHLPMVHFAVPRVFVAASSRLTNLAPAVLRPQLLWAVDSIAVK